MSAERPDCWVLSDGKAGTENQCLGLADLVGLPYTVRRLSRRAVTDWIPAGFWTATGTLALGLAAKDADLTPPWPRLLIAAGRPSVGPALALRRAARGSTFVVQLQDPRVPPSLFDLVVPPEHDGLHGANVLPTVGALHRVTKDSRKAARTTWQARFERLPAPRIAVLIGGDSRHHRLDTAVAQRLADQVSALVKASGGSLMVTASRRTGTKSRAVIERALRGPATDFWDGNGDNPYQGILAWADAIVVTEDSVTMASEAASTGVPVFIAALEGGSAKFRRFHDTLAARGIARPLDGTWTTWTYRPLDETARIAAAVRERLAQPGG